MKLRLGHTEYDLDEGLTRVDLYTLFELKSKYGIGMKTLLTTANSLRGVKDPMEVLENEDALQALLALIWLTRRAAGEKLTLEEANSTPLANIEWVDDEEEAEEPDPPHAPTDSDPAGASPARASTRTSSGTSKTSKRR